MITIEIPTTLKFSDSYYFCNTSYKVKHKSHKFVIVTTNTESIFRFYNGESLVLVTIYLYKGEK